MVKLFTNYLADWTWCVLVEDKNLILKGSPRGPFWDLFCFLFI